MCNVVVVFRTATVGCTLHLLPCGTVSTFCIVLSERRSLLPLLDLKCFLNVGNLRVARLRLNSERKRSHSHRP